MPTTSLPSLLALAFNVSIKDEWVRKAQEGPSSWLDPTLLAKLTQEQQNGLHVALALTPGQSILFDAKAGSGKSFELFLILAHLASQDLAQWPQVFSRTAQDGSSYLLAPTISTIHAIGRKALLAKGIRLDRYFGVRKNKDFIIAQSLGLFKGSSPVGHRALALCRTAKLFGVSPGDRGTPLLEDCQRTWNELGERFRLDVSSESLSAARQILSISIDQAKKTTEHEFLTRTNKRVKRRTAIIDQADMLYIPVLFAGSFERYDWLVIDEVQDLSPIRIEVTRRCVKWDKGRNLRSRVLAAGDPAQAIYQFSGADTDAMSKVRDLFGMTTLPLNESFRCSRAVIREAQKIVPAIYHRKDAPEGWVGNVQELMTREGQAASNSPKILPQNLPRTILCRNNAPNVALSIFLLSKRIPVLILGRDEFLAPVREVFEKIKRRARGTLNLSDFLVHLERYLAREKKGSSALLDNTEILRVVARELISQYSPALPCDRILSFLEELYPQNDERTPGSAHFPSSAHSSSSILFSSIHKSKGLEWGSIGILEPALIGAFAEQAWEIRAERNLRYVARTRAISSILYFNLDDVEGFEAFRSNLQ